MADDASPPAAAPPPAPSLPSAAHAPKAPVAIIRDKATFSSWMDHDIASREQHRKIELAAADREQGIIDTAKDRPGEVGITKTADIGQGETHPVCIIQIVLAGGRKEQYIQGDFNITDLPDGSIEGALNIICPKCVAKGVPQAQAQIRISDRNKRLSLNQDTKGLPWVDPDTGEVFQTAGTLELDEKSRCDRCGFTFRISPNGPQAGVSRLVIE